MAAGRTLFSSIKCMVWYLQAAVPPLQPSHDQGFFLSRPFLSDHLVSSSLPLSHPFSPPIKSSAGRAKMDDGEGKLKTPIAGVTPVATGIRWHDAADAEAAQAGPGTAVRQKCAAACRSR